MLVYIGRLAPEKNTQLLLQMMRQLRSEPEYFCLLMVGDGIQRTSLKKTARTELPGLVQFFGYIKDRDVLAEVLANCDLFIHPNPNEPFGIAPLEAMASGVPVVAPDSGGILEFANQSNAFLAEALPAKFAEAVLTCVRDSQLRARKVGKSYLHGRRFRSAAGCRLVPFALRQDTRGNLRATTAGGSRSVIQLTASGFSWQRPNINLCNPGQGRISNLHSAADVVAGKTARPRREQGIRS